jgi:hypothetical protein
LDELMKDARLVAELGKAFPSGKEQSWRRMFCRSVFGMLEAGLSVVREVYLPARKAQGVFAGDAEKAAYFNRLYDATDPHEWVLNEKGKAEQRTRKISFRPYLKACIRMMYLLHGKAQEDADGLFASAKWHALVRAVKVRDGITHPHGADDIEVSQEAAEDLGVAFEIIGEWWRFIAEATREDTERKNREAERLKQEAAEHRETTAKVERETSIVQQLHQEILDKKPVVHAIVMKTQDKVTGYLVKHPRPTDGSAVTQQVQVVELATPECTCFVVRMLDAPRLEPK